MAVNDELVLKLVLAASSVSMCGVDGPAFSNFSSCSEDNEAGLHPATHSRYTTQTHKKTVFQSRMFLYSNLTWYLPNFTQAKS